MKLARLIITCCLFTVSSVSHADIEIVITRGVDQALPVAVVPFHWQNTNPPPLDVAAIITNDLVRSGYFNAMPVADMPQQPHNIDMINYADWRKLQMDHILMGELDENSAGGYTLIFRLVNVINQQQIAGFRVQAKKSQLRWAAHQIADLIFEKLTGIRGSFATYIAYITVQKENNRKVYRLQIADSDGYNARILRVSPHPLLAPNWSPDGKKLAYVSFETKNSAIYMQDIYTGKRDIISAEPGINSSPVFSPDGGRLALTLSRNGNPDIYVMYLDSRILKRLTYHPAIDTEPTWSPDGNSLAFTSDRDGSPQIYTIPITDGKPRRLTYEGKYNTRPRYSPDGKYIAMVHAAGGGYHIAVMELASRYLNVVTSTAQDESPSFSPNSSMILYATRSRRQAHLAAVSVDGLIEQQLRVQRGEVREPAWGPYQIP